MEDLKKQLESLSPEERAKLFASLQQPETVEAPVKPARKPRAAKPKAAPPKEKVRKTPKKTIVEVEPDDIEEAPIRSRQKRRRRNEEDEYYNKYDRRGKSRRREKEEEYDDRGEGTTCRVEPTPLGKRINIFDSGKFSRIRDEAKVEEKFWDGK